MINKKSIKTYNPNLVTNTRLQRESELLIYANLYGKIDRKSTKLHPFDKESEVNPEVLVEKKDN